MSVVETFNSERASTGSLLFRFVVRWFYPKFSSKILLRELAPGKTTVKPSQHVRRMNPSLPVCVSF